MFSVGECPEMDVNYPRNDIGSDVDVKTWQECSNLCVKKPECYAWTWWQEKCHYKNEKFGLEKTSMVGAVSGPVTCIGKVDVK